MLITAFTFYSEFLSAQNTSVLGRFEVDFVRGCAGMEVNINVIIPGLTTTPQFWYEGFDSDVPGDPNQRHTYTNPGEFYLVMNINDVPPPDGNASQKDSIFIEVIEPQIPTFTVHNCANHLVSVEITDDYYESYRVEFTTNAADDQSVAPLSFSTPHNYSVQGTYPITVTGIFNNAADNCNSDNAQINTINTIVNPIMTRVETTLKDNSGTIELGFTTGDDIIYNLQNSTNGSDNFEQRSLVTGSQLTITGIDNTSDYYCYRIDTYDACNDLTIYSDTLCSVNFRVEGTDGANRISWNTDTIPAISYDVIRDGSSIATITDPRTTTYDDSDVICNIEYVYNVQANYKQQNTIRPLSVSSDTSIISFVSGVLPAVDYPQSTVNAQNSVELTWSPPDTGQIPFRQYIIQKNINNRSWRNIGNARDTTYTDLEPNFFGTHAYRILYDDDCGNISSGSPATEPMIINQINTRGKIVTYEWNKYETWLTGIRNYTVQRVDENGTVLEEFNVLSGRQKQIEFSPNDSENKWMRVRAESLDPTPHVSYSNIILTALDTEMYLPNAFTPNDDGLNDSFLAKGPKVFNFKMEVYTRWGELIFISEDVLIGWDGTVNGEKAPEGTYIYKIYFQDAEERSYDQSGAMILMRPQ